MHVVHGEHAPRLRMQVDESDSGDWVLSLKTQNFVFSEVHQNGEHLEGEGHGHLYVDGIKSGRVFSEKYVLPKLSAGQHEITAGLYTNNHMAYWAEDNPVQQSVTIGVD